MSRVLSAAVEMAAFPVKNNLYLRIAILLTSSLLVCTSLIYFFGTQLTDIVASGMATVADIALVSLLPYFLAGVVLATTVVAVSTIWPSTKTIGPSEAILQRLRLLTGGDLGYKERIQAEGPMKEITYELSRAIGMLRMQINEMKIINRQQWATLGEIRAAVERGDRDSALTHIREMERTWQRTAEIERKLRT